MPIRRIAVEEAFITADVVAEWRAVLASADVEPGFVELGGTMLKPVGKPLIDRLLDVGSRRVAHMDSNGIDMQVLALTAPACSCSTQPRRRDSPLNPTISSPTP
jgi:2,3-dihydroxybenzoate decarboxylase